MLASCAMPAPSIEPNGYATYEFTCSYSSGSFDIDSRDDCHESARAACPEGYEVLEETYPLGRLHPNVRGVYVVCSN